MGGQFLQDTRSHSVLLTNLANRIQPLIRYDLGDAVTIERYAVRLRQPVSSDVSRGSD